jgi:hypothetical protein
MKEAIKAFWRRITTSTEVALLRAENKRLREANFVLEEEIDAARKELRAAVNNLLSQAGVAPLPPNEEIKPPAHRHRNLTLQQRQRLYAVATTPAPPKEGTHNA